MLIFIIGYMGAGKTTLGKKLAEGLNYHFFDLDEMIITSTGYSISRYFEKFGEGSFRQKEREILLNHLDDRDTVIATGGGTACYADNMVLMNQKGITIYIDTPFEIVMKRLVLKGQQRPLLKGIPTENLPEFIKKHLKTRQDFYLQAAIKVDGEDVDLEKLIDAVRSNDADRSVFSLP